MSTGGGNSGLYRWDPEKSTRDKITTYASVLDEKHLSHDFTGLSELLLGQAQPAQFLNNEQTGYWFGSAYQASTTSLTTNANQVPNTSGETVTIDDVEYKINQNANANMPRTKQYRNNNYYNWIAAVAESAGQDIYGLRASDSVCPKGWQLPVSANSGSPDKSWWNLFANVYDIFRHDGNDKPRDGDNNNSASDAIRKLPFNYQYGGDYLMTGSMYHSGLLGEYWAGESADYGKGKIMNLRYFYLYTNNFSWKGAAESVRCVLK